MANQQGQPDPQHKRSSISFFAQPNPRSGNSTKDVEFLNVFGESWKTPQSGDQYIYLRKRPGLRYIASYEGGEVRGSYSIRGRNFFAVGGAIYEYTGGVLTQRQAGIGPSTGPINFTIFSTESSDYLVYTDGQTLFRMDLATNIPEGLPPKTPMPLNPFLETVDGYLLLNPAGTADIYNSQVADFDSAFDFTSAEMYPDNLVGLSRYNNYFVALGESSIELFYDAAFTEGSPFQRNESAVMTIGCEAPSTALQTDTQFYWVGTTQEGERSVWLMENFKPREIATPFVKEAINEEGANLKNAKATTLRFMGHQFYVLHLTQSTWLYDTREQLWHQWTYNGGNFPDFVSFDYELGESYIVTNGTLYELDEESYQDNGIPISCSWDTVPLDFDTMDRKNLHRLTLIGDLPNGAQNISVSWSDNDYTTWHTPRAIDVTKGRPATMQLGQFRRRSFRFTFTDNAPLRLKGYELIYSLGMS